MLSNLDLSIKNKDVQFIFIGSEVGKSLVQVVCFDNCNTVEFIPASLLKEFPNMIGMAIHNSKISVLKTDLFTASFNKIKYLELKENKIKDIEAEAFSALTDLKCIILSENEIEEIPHNIFEKNLKFEKICLKEDKLQLLHPEIFEGLDNLSDVTFHGKSFNKSEGPETFWMMIDRELSVLYSNYVKKYGYP